MKQVTAEQAKKKGLKRFFTGEPCRNGHLAERRISDRVCVECKRIKDSKRPELRDRGDYYQRNRETIIARKKRVRENNPDHQGITNEYAAITRAKRHSAVVSWADRKRLREIYVKAFHKGLDVDHIVPYLAVNSFGEHIACGLHCEANLQLLTAAQNGSKGNRHWPDKPDDHQWFPEGSATVQDEILAELGIAA